MAHHKFNPEQLAKLENPERRRKLPPEAIVQLMQVQAGDQVADIGAGIGYVAIPLGHAVGANGKVFACDTSPAMLEAGQALTPSELKQIEWKLSEESRLPIDDHCCQAAVLVAVYHELHEPAAMLQELRRILAPGGRLLIVDWKAEATLSGPPLNHRVAAATVIKQLENAGFLYIIEMPDFAEHYAISGTVPKQFPSDI
ncbi:class I SAM-dependent methyltransferase [Heliophilum fasciatum]|uniref:Methyltransferase family protein n=1 Tax=Heliophilum fasciatum TaxID=35700 RepID=A0A4V2SWW7_9FIRM|nr:methyltransferase domain-containing protein [Heliophilum fasciatum]MCW2278395.1 ubiquinone/menaquinone biosynthesis C-methylase UbiE [Heliophilum fasciatum]TCP63706.1 methyltransferase family protein [Heliophilum fasciatum]